MKRFNKLRFTVLVLLYNGSKWLYLRLFKFRKKKWNIWEHELKYFPEGTLGKDLAIFYKQYGIHLMPKLESHDVCHVLSETGIEAQDEIAMQYFLLGNGKISPYLIGVIAFGTILYPEFFSYYRSHFNKGKRCVKFYAWNFEHLLWESTHKIKQFVTRQLKNTETISI